MRADGAFWPMDGFKMFTRLIGVGKNRVCKINVHWITPLLIDLNLVLNYTYVKYTLPDWWMKNLNNVDRVSIMFLVYEQLLGVPWGRKNFRTLM